MSMVPDAEFGVLQQEQEIFIEAPSTRVWEALTDRIGAWWPRDYFVSAEAKNFVLEARLGGRLFEDWGDGQGVVWGQVVGLRRNSLLQIAGELMETDSPARIHTIYRLAEKNGGTVLRLVDLAYGRLTAKNAQCLEEGWRELLHKHLKPYVEAS
jgi:uncharacterized protein YndB with AHSA1/START domain